jgi:divalent metal cation (Fe/Co/Zn/Cd) transporter
MSSERNRFYRRAEFLALLTVFYNIAEGLVSVWFGVSDETFALFGFGLDSFVEVMSGVGVWHMVRRLRAGGDERRDDFERRALRITGSGFYLLALGLVVTTVAGAIQGHRPESTFWGVVVSSVSIVTMWLLIRAKVRVGTALSSAAILADAGCTRVCLYLSFILLGASAGYELLGIPLLDAAGAFGVAWFSWKEGREAFDKARGLNCSCSCSCSSSG